VYSKWWRKDSVKNYFSCHQDIKLFESKQKKTSQKYQKTNVDDSFPFSLCFFLSFARKNCLLFFSISFFNIQAQTVI